MEGSDAAPWLQVGRDAVTCLLVALFCFTSGMLPPFILTGKKSLVLQKFKSAVLSFMDFHIRIIESLTSNLVI